VAGRHDNAPAASSSYAAGYSACAAAAVRHITQLDHVDPATRQALAARLDDHLAAARRRRRDVTAPAVTSPRRRRRPLADIQPTASRQPPTVSRSVTAAAACDCVAFPFPVDALSTELVAMVTMTSTTVQQQQHGHVYQQVRETGDDDFVSSRQVAPRGDSRCAHPVASGNVREPMWRPW